MSGPTLGVEEELHVVDSRTGHLVSRGLEVQQSSKALAADGSVVLELTLSQIETVTAVSRDVPQALERVRRLRSCVASAAADRGLALLASGTPVLGDIATQRVADDERYHPLRAQAAGLIAEQLIAGMHVHVGVGGPNLAVEDVDDDARVAVANVMRPWLPTLLALTANSPFWLGVDTGFASYRQVQWQRWPVVGPPPTARDGEHWRRSVAELIATGVVVDASYVYWDVRLATRFPTVEVRVADVQARAEDAATYAALVRGLAAAALLAHDARSIDGRRGAARLGPDVPQHALRAAMWHAARYGLDANLVDPIAGSLRPAPHVLAALVHAARPGLELTGDDGPVSEGVRRVLSDGNGAQRQRAAFLRSGWAGVLDVVRVSPAHRRLGAPPATLNDGNGWVDCDCGHRHWGRHGAAGLLLLRPGGGGSEVLLQLRAAWTHQGGTWGLPGGARDSHESTSQAARREANEETGVDPGLFVDVVEHRIDHGTWSYTYVVATAPPQMRAYPANHESDAVDWVPVDDVAGRDLHPALALEWPRLRELVRGVRC